MGSVIKSTTQIATELALPTPYTGLVGTRCFQNTDTIGTVGWQINSRTIHRARDTITSLQAIFAGYYVSTSEVETANTGVLSIDAAIEYPLGTTTTSFTFSASATGTIPNGGTLTTDALAIAIPDGALFAVRSFQRGTANVTYMSNWVATSGDSCEASASGLTNRTTATGSYGSAPTFVAPPAALIAQTSKVSIAIYGDSKQLGLLDTADSAMDVGQLCRTLGPIFAYTNCARSGGKAQDFISSHTNRVALAAYASHVVVGYFFNDFAAGRTGAQMETDLATIVGYFSGKPIYCMTISPKTTGAWTLADASDQTVTGNESNRTTFNNDLRKNAIANVSSKIRGVIDVETANETSYNSGKWIAGATTDGVHESTLGALLIQRSGCINPAQFKR
jgi:hypothetical protein